MNGLSPAVLGLVIVNAVAFVAGLLGQQLEATLIEEGAFWFSGHPNFAVWQFITYLFLHGGPGHILFNMFALVSFGVLLERRWGTWRFLVFYFLCGIGAAVIHNGVNLYQYVTLRDQLIGQGLPSEAIEAALATGRSFVPLDEDTRSMLRKLFDIYATPTIGASGAIYGVLVAFGLLYPNAKLALMFVPVPVAAKIMIPILLGLDLLSGLTGFSLFGGGVAHFAHLGGALIGFTLLVLWRRTAAEPPAPPRF